MFKCQKHPTAHPDRGCGAALIIDGMIFAQKIYQQVKPGRVRISIWFHKNGELKLRHLTLQWKFGH